MTAAGPTALFVACLVSGLVVPVPEDVALLVAGWQVQTGDLSIGGALAAGVAGTLGRDVAAFALGRLIGPRLERLTFLRRVLGEARIGRAHALFERRGNGMLFLTRFAVGLRAPLYFVGGTLGFPIRRFLVLDLCGLALTVPACLWLGATFGEDAASGLRLALGHQRLVLATIAVGLGAWLLAQRARGRTPEA